MYGKKCETSYQDENSANKMYKKELMFDVDGVVSRYSGAQLQQIDDVCHSVELEKKMKRRARHQLVSRKLLSQPTTSDATELPGGFWRDTATVEFPAPADSEYAATDESEGQETEDLVVAAEEISLEDLQTDEDIQPVVKSHISKVSSSSRRPLYSISSQQEEEVRKQEVKQRALLRRLYMDMEREQVKEYKKLKSHMHRIQEIKKVKEEERSRQELQSEMELFPPPCPSPSLSDTARELLNKERQLRKEKETKRYVKALRSLLIEKVERLGVDVPPLCSCGENIWDTHPDLCANNCPFYKNPKGYERAVQALLTSCDISD